MNDLEVKRAALSQLIGRRVADDLNVLRRGVMLRAPEPTREADWTEGARQNNFAVQQARIAAEIARREIDKQRYGHYPTLDVVGSLGAAKNATVNVIGITGVTSTSGVLGLQLSLPIYNGGAVDSRVREAVALRDKSAFDLDNARRVAEQGARQSFLGFKSGLAQVRRAGSGREVEPARARFEPARLPGRRAHQHRRAERAAAAVHDAARPGQARATTC